MARNRKEDQEIQAGIEEYFVGGDTPEELEIEKGLNKFVLRVQEHESEQELDSAVKKTPKVVTRRKAGDPLFYLDLLNS